MRQLIAIALATSIVSLAVLSTPARSLEPVPDGSFENGAPPASLWSETTNHSNDCPTAIADWQSIFQATAPDGSKSFWAGGFCNGSTPGAITNSASQVLTVPVDDAALSFGYLGLRIDANNPALDDVAYVSVDGTDVWTRDASTAAVNTWNTAHTGGAIARRRWTWGPTRGLR